ncbi:hypothetical protein [Actinomadura nitritigenes]|uniref:hypothetical protein n=1 Tax=Actinomadura nitritigenes TaxID=134602 RepID=UPI003D8F4150
MLTMTATSDGDGARIALPTGEVVRTGDPDAGAVLSRALGRRVEPASVPPEGAALDRAVPEEVLAAGVTAEVAVEETVIGLGAPPGGGFVDFAPLHLIGTATLDAIGAASPRGTAEDVRYRPNLVLRTAGPAFGENDWAGREMAAGTRNRVEPMPGLGLRACAGVYARVLRPGRIRRGAAVRLL